MEKMEKCLDKADFSKLEADFLRLYTGSKLSNAPGILVRERRDPGPSADPGRSWTAA